MKYVKLLQTVILISPLLSASEDLRDYVSSLEDRIEELENKKESKGTLNLSSINTTMFIGGRISLDTIFLSDANGKDGGSNSNDQFFGASYIPIDPKGESDELTLTARNSKFWIKTRTHQEGGIPIMTLLEFDFWGSNGNEKNTNSHNPRLRHAYFVYNGWTVGQTNSLFIGTSKAHTLLAPVNNILMRQPLISYKQKLPQSSLAFSLEEPESLILTPQGEKVAINDDRLPDMALRYEYHQAWYAYSLSLLGRELRINQEKDLNIEDQTFGYGINLTAHINTHNNNAISMTTSWGKGLGRYLATGFFPDAVINQANQIEAQRSWGADIAYEHWFNEKIRLNMTIGKVATHNLSDIETLDKEAYSEHIGLQYSPIKKMLLGFEYIHAKRTLENEESYLLDRLYLRASYDF